MLAAPALPQCTELQKMDRVKVSDKFAFPLSLDMAPVVGQVGGLPRGRGSTGRFWGWEGAGGQAPLGPGLAIPRAGKWQKESTGREGVMRLVRVMPLPGQRPGRRRRRLGLGSRRSPA